MTTIIHNLVLVTMLVVTATTGHSYYSPTTGRWLSRDPERERAGPNLYGFALNRPLSLFDVLGREPSTRQYDYEGTTVTVTADAWSLVPCLGGPLWFSVHWSVHYPDEGGNFGLFTATFYDDSGPGGTTPSPPVNVQHYPWMEWDNLYSQYLPLCPRHAQHGSVGYYVTANSAGYPAGDLNIIFHWSYSCDCACREKDPLRVSYEFETTPPLNPARSPSPK